MKALKTTRKSPNMMDYVKEELAIIQYQPSIEVVFDFIRQKSDEICGIKNQNFKSLDEGDNLEEGNTLEEGDDESSSSNSNSFLMMTATDGSTLFTNDQSIYGTAAITQGTRLAQASPNIVTPLSSAHGLTSKHSQFPDVVFVSRPVSTRYSSEAVITPSKPDMTLDNNSETLMIAAPSSYLHRSNNGFKHIQLPPSVYVMAAAYDMQETKK